MAKSTNLNFTQNIKTPMVSLNNASGTTLVTLFTAGANDSVMNSIIATTNDTTTVNLCLVVNDGTTDRYLGCVNLPINSGRTGSIASVDVLGSTLIPGLSKDISGRSVLKLQAGYIVKVGVLSAITSGKVVDVIGASEDY